jgi:O-methyltransferase
MKVKKVIKSIFRKFGYEVVRQQEIEVRFPDFENDHIDIFKKVESYTQTSPERIFSLIEAVKYITQNQIEGGIVECGVWKGGSIMAVLETLLNLSSQDREIYLFDTFEGMSEPTDIDVDFTGNKAENMMIEENGEILNRVTLGDVQKTISNVGYDQRRIHYVKGKVEDTLPAHAPEKISLLRLDTDWYESTYHELVHLFPRLSFGGIIIIDDYGHFEGARKATDEYISEKKVPLLLNRIDYTGRIAVKI